MKKILRLVLYSPPPTDHGVAAMLSLPLKSSLKAYWHQMTTTADKLSYFKKVVGHPEPPGNSLRHSVLSVLQLLIMKPCFTLCALHQQHLPTLLPQ